MVCRLSTHSHWLGVGVGGDRIVQVVECRSRDLRVAGSNPVGANSTAFFVGEITFAVDKDVQK